MEAIKQPGNLERLFRETADDLTRYFTRRHSDGELARDLVQETFAEMASSLQSGCEPRSQRAYLFGIARKVSAATWKRKERENTVITDYSTNEPPAPEPDSRVDAAHEAIANLPGLQREILDLRFTHGLSYAEMAETLGIPIGTVRSRLHNAIHAVRDTLKDE